VWAIVLVDNQPKLFVFLLKIAFTQMSTPIKIQAFSAANFHSNTLKQGSERIVMNIHPAAILNKAARKVLGSAAHAARSRERVKRQHHMLYV
jgi:hypothetical protein